MAGAGTGRHHTPAMNHFPMIISTDHIRVVCLTIVASVAAAADHPGVAIYMEHCSRCHGATGGHERGARSTRR